MERARASAKVRCPSVFVRLWLICVRRAPSPLREPRRVVYPVESGSADGKKKKKKSKKKSKKDKKSR